MKLNKKATKENLKATIELLSKMKRIAGHNWSNEFDFGGIKNCKLCSSAKVHSHMQTENCKNCILNYRKINNFNCCGCDDNNEFDDIINMLFYVKDASTKKNAFKLIRKNIPEFIKLCKKNNITIPKIIVNF